MRLNKHYNTKVSSTDPVDVVGRDAVRVRRQPTKLKPTTSVLVTRCTDDLSLLSAVGYFSVVKKF